MTFTRYVEGKIYSKITQGCENGDDSMPILLFIHAAIADHSMWDEQVKFLSQKGFTCIQLDMFGFGLSEPSQDYLKMEQKTDVDYIQHIVDLINGYRSNSKSSQKAILIGLSMGGGLAIRCATLHPELTAGVVAAACGVPGYGTEGEKKEQELDAEIETTIESGDAEKAADLLVHYWGDGPLQAEGRCSNMVRERLYDWCLDIAKRTHQGTGGFGLPSVRRGEIKADTLAALDFPFAVAIGNFDETSTNAGQEYLAKTVKDADLHRFDAAHVVNLECKEEFNDWLFAWLKRKNFVK